MLEHRDEAEENAGERGNDEGEHQAYRVNGYFVQARQTCRAKSNQQTDSPVRQRNAQRAAHNSERHTFEQQLTSQLTPPGAQGRPNC